MSTLGEIEQAGERLFAADAAHGLSLAMVVMIGGNVAHERYGHQPDTIFGPGGAVDAHTPLISWSMAKSITHAAAWILAGEGRVDLSDPAPVAAWRGTDKERITLLDLLEMRSGLRFVEDYVDHGVSNCLEMLFGKGHADMAGYAAALPADHRPGEVWNYASGTTNIVCRILGDALGDRAGEGHAAMSAFLAERLFAPAGMHTAQPTFDAAGTFIGSSYVHASALDFARFGELYRNDGRVGEHQVLPPGCLDHARTFVAADPDGELHYGRHWWLLPWFPGSLAAVGYEGQLIIVEPSRELVLVHLGKVPAEGRPALVAELRRVIDAVPVLR